VIVTIWVNRELKVALKKKRWAFEHGDVSQMNVIQKEIRQMTNDVRMTARINKLKCER